MLYSNANCKWLSRVRFNSLNAKCKFRKWCWPNRENHTRNDHPWQVSSNLESDCGASTKWNVNIGWAAPVGQLKTLSRRSSILVLIKMSAYRTPGTSYQLSEASNLCELLKRQRRSADFEVAVLAALCVWPGFAFILVEQGSRYSNVIMSK